MNIDLKAILAMLICFIIGSLSLYEILNMAKPMNFAKQFSASITESMKPIDELTQSPALLNYNYTKQYLSTNTNIYKNQNMTMKAFVLNPKITELSAEKQDYVIRVKLLEWKFKWLQEQLEKISSAQTEPLIFKIGFWGLSILLWICAAIFKNILDYYTKIKIIPRLFKDPT